MNDKHLRSDLIKLASELPVGSSARKKILAVLQKSAIHSDLLRHLNTGAAMGPAAEEAAKEQVSMWEFNWEDVASPEDREVWLQEIDATCGALLKWKKALERSGMTPDAGESALLGVMNWSRDPMQGGPQAEAAAKALVQAWGMYWDQKWLREIDGTCKVLMDWKKKLQRSGIMRQAAGRQKTARVQVEVKGLKALESSINRVLDPWFREGKIEDAVLEVRSSGTLWLNIDINLDAFKRPDGLAKRDSYDDEKEDLANNLRKALPGWKVNAKFPWITASPE